MLSFLIATLSKEEQDIFDLLYKNHFYTLRRIALGLLHREDLAQDAMQNAFIAVFHNFQKIHNLECREQTHYLVKIVRNASFDVLRNEKKYTQTENLDDWQDTLPSSEHPDPTGYAVDLIVERERLQQLAKELSEMEQFLLFGSIQHGFSYRELASMSFLTENNVSVKISRAKAKLRAWRRREEREDEN